VKKPKRLFRVRRVRGADATMIGPAFRREPHYSSLVEELIRRHQAEIEAGVKEGRRYGFEIRHDDWCPTLKHGRCCNCNVIVNLIELPGPKDN
jgi:hypothetical protein